MPKSDGRQRPLGIAALEDKIIQQVVLWVLQTIYEQDFLGFSYRFRPGRAPHAALDALSVAITSKRVNWIPDADIEACFDEIGHAWLLDHVPMDRTILKHWLKAGYLEKDVFFATTEGTPQGRIISPALANRTLDGLQALLHERFGATRSQRERNQVHLVRYAGARKRGQVHFVRSTLRAVLGKMYLTPFSRRTRLGQKGKWPGWDAPNSSHAAVEPPAERRGLNHTQ